MNVIDSCGVASTVRT